MYNCSLSRSDISTLEATQDLRAFGFALPVRHFSRRARHCLEPPSSPHDPELTRPVNSKLTFLGKRTKSREAAKRRLRNSASLQQGNQKKSHPIGASTGNSPEPAAEYNRSRSAMVSSMQPRPRSGTVGGPLSGMIYRPSITDHVKSASRDSVVSIESGSGNEEQLLASGNGVSMSITLAEPCLFLQGFEQAEDDNRTTSMLRGYLTIRVSKSAKIKSVTLAFRGRAETDWPEGIPPRKTEYKDRESIMNHTWPFFNAQFPTAEYGSGADSVQALKGPITTTVDLGTQDGANERSYRPSLVPDPGAFPARQAKRLSLEANQSRSFGRDDPPRPGSVAQKGYRTFTPGVYMYNFELPIDSRLPETINVDLGNVKYELEATIERAGAFRANLVGSKEVTLIRAPAEGSLETVEPIAISRNWEDQLHYDIVISGKSFPLGAQIPIAFKLTPLAKVQCHRVKVYVTENIQYYTSNKQVHRLEPTRKVQLFEKRADGKSTSAYAGSSMRITAGGGIAYNHREAAARGDDDVPRDLTNLLGCVDNERSVGPTEMEFNVQLPSCQAMRERDRLAQLHFDTTYQNIQVHHWIKVSPCLSAEWSYLIIADEDQIVMRLSKPDPSGASKRRHFEISIDSPLHILSCRATQANTALPAYSSPESATMLTEHYECGCPGATKRKNSPLLLPTRPDPANEGLAPSSNQRPASVGDGLTRPPQAHVHDPNSTVSRPIHLLRNPSFNPPPFSEEDPPPPLVTPPPQYNTLVDGDPRNGLADYFARLADEVGDDDEDEDETLRRTRINLPLTPGGRVNRSMDVQRTWLPLGAARD